MIQILDFMWNIFVISLALMKGLNDAYALPQTAEYTKGTRSEFSLNQTNTLASRIAESSNPSMSVRPFIRALSTSHTLVAINTGRQRLHIPRNYLESAEANGTYFILLVSFPQFRGVENINDPTLETGYPYYSTKWITVKTETAIQAYSRNEDKYIEMTHTHVSNTKFGLIQIDSPFQGIRIYVSPANTGDSPTVIQCNEVGEKFEVYCSVSAYVTSSFAVIYSFSPSLLAHWRQINDGVTLLLNSFVEK